MFFFAGIGNAGTFKQMPMIMPKRQVRRRHGLHWPPSPASALLFGVALSAMDAAVWFWICAAYSALCAVICWICYARPERSVPLTCSHDGGSAWPARPVHVNRADHRLGPLTATVKDPMTRLH